MNMLQMLGGVAVAGAVAAGTTAFTASGITGPAIATTIGGVVTITPTGAAITSVAATWASATVISDFKVTFASGVATGTPVAMVVTDATGNLNAGAPTFTCSTTSLVATCSADATYTLGSITAIKITV